MVVQKEKKREEAKNTVFFRMAQYKDYLFPLRAASSCTSIPSCATPINFSYSKNTLFNIPDYIIRK